MVFVVVFESGRSLDRFRKCHKEKGLYKKTRLDNFYSIVVFLETFRVEVATATWSSLTTLCKSKTLFKQSNVASKKKRKREESFERVNESQREELWNVYTNHFLIQPCVSAIWKKILAKGIEICERASSRRSTPT